MRRPHRAVRSLRLLLVTLVLSMISPGPAGAAERVFTPAHALDRVIVGFRPDAGRLARQRAVRAAGTATAPASAAVAIAADVVLVTLAPGRSVRRAVRQLETRAAVSYAEPDYRVWPASAADDPLYLGGSLWGMYGDDTVPHANAFGSGAGEAWARGQVGGHAVYVGMVDEGVQAGHPDLAANVWRNPFEVANGLDDDANGYVDDVHGWDFYHDDATTFDGAVDDHGTHVAGTVGAEGGNGIGVAGVAWRVGLIPAKFLGPDGGYVSGAVRALDYLTDLRTRHGLPIVASNNSWSGGGHSQALEDAIDRGGDAGILFVAAAGNDGRDIDAAPAYPASYRCVAHADGSARGWDCLIGVTAIGPDGELTPGSSWALGSVDLAAPGSGILSSHPSGEGYARLSGTSMATAHVSGALALCAGLDPTLSARRLRSLLFDATVATTSLSGRTASGGRLDAGGLALACAPDPPTPEHARVEVDDLDPAFRRAGQGWREGTSGHAGHHFWAPTRETVRTLYGAWRPLLPAEGWYDVLVHIPPTHATSRKASYRVKTSSGWVTRVRNQDKHAGTWVSLGLHHLTTTPILQLADRTGEDESLGRRLAFDGARFEPRAGPATD